MQLTLVLMLGFCVLGCGLIPLFLVVKGAGTGCFFALLYTQVGTVKGLFLQALIFWLPEVLGSLIVILLSAFALRVSLGLAQGCTGQFPPALRQLQAPGASLPGAVFCSHGPVRLLRGAFTLVRRHLLNREAGRPPVRRAGRSGAETSCGKGVELAA